MGSRPTKRRRTNMSHLFPILLFGFINGITPGPNNILLMTSGANWGFRRTLPLVLGISVGFPVVLAATGIGLKNVFAAFPLLHVIMKYLCGFWVLVIAYKILKTPSPGDSHTQNGTLITFRAALLFQWINPKVWLIAVSAMTLFISDQLAPLQIVMGIVIPITAVTIPANLVWCFFGLLLAKMLNTSGKMRIFNVTMVVALIASVIPVFLP